MLNGVKVLDLSRILAGPYCTQILGDLGANVIKIERPGAGDDTRHWGPPFVGDTAAYYLTANRNKRARALDFTTAEDRKVCQGLAANADVVVENFRPGALARYGLDYDSVREANPGVVYCSISGFGSDGPGRDLPGYDALIQAMGGMMSITGPDAATPTKVGVAVADLSSGMWAVIGILAALRERDASGRGQHVEVALLDTQVAMLANVAMAYLTTGSVPTPLGNAHATVVPYQTFATADRPITIAVGNDRQFEALCRTLGERWHEDPRFADNPGRVRNRDELIALIAPRLLAHGRDHWLSAFDGAGFPSGPVNDLSDVAADPQVRHRELFTTMDDGTTPCLRSPMRFSRTPIDTYRTPPDLDADPDAGFS